MWQKMLQVGNGVENDKAIVVDEWGTQANYNGSYTNRGTLTQYDDYQELIASGTGGNVASVLYLDLTDIDVIYIKIKALTGYISNSRTCFVSNNEYAYTGNWSSGYVKTLYAQAGMNFLDVSSLTGFYYVGIGIGCNASTSQIGATIEKIKALKLS